MKIFEWENVLFNAGVVMVAVNLILGGDKWSTFLTLIAGVAVKAICTTIKEAKK